MPTPAFYESGSSCDPSRSLCATSAAAPQKVRASLHMTAHATGRQWIVIALAVVAMLVLMDPPARADQTGDIRDQDATEHRAVALGLTGGVYGALYLYAYLAWYSDGAQTTLHLRDEGWLGRDTYAGGADKVGHLWANYALTRSVSRVLEWGGYSKPLSLVTSTGLAVGFFVLVEVKDGYEPDYGFSWGDIVFNLAGNVLGVGFELLPELDRMFDFRLEYWPSRYFIEEARSTGPFNSAEDYTGQRYLLAFHLASIDALRTSSCCAWTQWLDLTVGYHAVHYKPNALDLNAPEQRLFAGVSINFQHIIDRALMPAAGSAQQPSTAARALRFGSELIAVPFTTLVITGASRSGGMLTRGRSDRDSSP